MGFSSVQNVLYVLQYINSHNHIYIFTIYMSNVYMLNVYEVCRESPPPTVLPPTSPPSKNKQAAVDVLLSVQCSMFIEMQCL